MALRNTKIVRELLSNNYKCFSNRAEIISPFSNNKGNEITETEIEHEGNNESAPFRYIVTHTQRPSVLPKIEFPKKEPEELIPPEMRYLQPSMLPKFMELREVKSEVEWEPLVTENKELECPFPEPIRELRTKTLTVSDMKKAELKSPSINVNFKNNNFSIINRNYSTSPYLIVSRTYAKTSKKGNEKCEDVPKKKCVKNTGCPSFIMRDCPVGKPKSDCFHHYTDPKCTKKLAPYPSYSESCAERLEDDPSECMQCPWQKCGGVESIKPPRRSYHTSIAGRQNLNSLPGYVINDVNFMPSKECNTKKEPCKRPPGKCEKRGEKKKEKCPEKKKKCDGWTSAYGFWSAKENILPSDPWLDIESDTIGNSLNCEGFKKIVFALVLGVCLAQPQRRLNSDIDESQPPVIQQYQEPRQKHETTTFIPIIRFDKEQSEDGSYRASYETGNNIFAEEEGYIKNLGPDPDAEGETLNAQVQQGSYSYTAPDGTIITVKYTADETGFHATGDHLPTPPPVSPEVQKGLELIYAGIRAQEEANAREAKENPQGARKEISQDYNGQYRP
ncbi:uncharacterized protein isoform X1 [Leptinotarsa decemlineata]|uniref:uncharacterized protein isoform X1 n=1 Tax=Leptinotarsa decemlineata TaxID=7539 RepID=UPI003D30A4B0